MGPNPSSGVGFFGRGIFVADGACRLRQFELVCDIWRLFLGRGTYSPLRKFCDGRLRFGGGFPLTFFVPVDGLRGM